MEIKIRNEEFFKVVSKVQTIIEKRSSMQILSTILISSSGSETLISATDLEIGFRQKIPSEVIVPGNMAISGRKLFEILKESKSKDLYIKEKENNWVFISDDEARYNIACQPSEDFPVLEEPKDVIDVAINGDILSEMINKTIYAVTMEETGFKLSGIYTEKVAYQGETFLRMVSTDGHRLSMVDKKIENIENLELEKGVMIPKKGMTELNKMASEGGTIHLGFKKNNCVAKRDDLLIVIRLLDSKFPDYNAVIPQKSGFSIEIGRVKLLDAMRKMIILSDERYRGVKINLDSNNMELVLINPDLGDVHEKLEVKYDQERMEMGFNSRYFIDILQAMESEVINLEFVDNLTPCLIKGDIDKGFLGLIMPMRL